MSKEGQIWKLHQIFSGIFELIYDSDYYSLLGRKVGVKEVNGKKEPVVVKENPSSWKVKYHKISDGNYEIKL